MNTPGHHEFTFVASSSAYVQVSNRNAASYACLTDVGLFSEAVDDTAIVVDFMQNDVAVTSFNLADEPQYFRFSGGNVIFDVSMQEVDVTGCFAIRISDGCEDPPQTLCSQQMKLVTESECINTTLVRTCVDHEMSGLQPGYFNVRLELTMYQPNWEFDNQQERLSNGYINQYYVDMQRIMLVDIKPLDGLLHPHVAAWPLFDHLYIREKEYVVDISNYIPGYEDRLDSGGVSMKVRPKLELMRKVMCDEVGEGCNPANDPQCPTPGVLIAHYTNSEGFTYVTVTYYANYGYIPVKFTIEVNGSKTTVLLDDGFTSYPFGPYVEGDVIDVQVFSSDEVGCVFTAPTIIGGPDPFSNVGLNNEVSQVYLHSDGKWICVGFFTLYDTTPAPRVTRLNPDGTLDTDFNTNVGTGSGSILRDSAVDSLGRVYVAGDFTSFDGVSLPYVVRLLPSGSYDSTFVMGTGFNDRVGTILVQPDDKIIFIGDFTSYDGTTANRIIRLETDGTVDATFNSGTGFNGGANARSWASIIDADGTILVSSGFGWTSYDGNAIIASNLICGIVRINPDGSYNSKATNGTAFDNGGGTLINCINTQADGKIVVTGAFIDYDGTAVPNIARLNTDGTIDATFNAGVAAGFSTSTSANAILDNGQIMVGNGSTFQTVNTNYLARLNANGTRDSSFNPSPGFNGSVTQIVPLTDGRTLVAGDFTTYNGVPRIRVAVID